MKRNTWIALVGAGVVAAGLLAWAFVPRAVEVEAVAARLGPFETAVEEDGRARVTERHAVTAPIAGRLRRMALREGDAVQAGQDLALIEPLPSPLLDERSRGEQQARAAAAQAALERAGTRVRAAQVGVDQALNEQRRNAQLVAQGFVSPAKADADRLALDAATREREGAVESERVARFELQQTRVALELSSAAASSGRTFTVRAPVAGMVLRVHQASEGVVGIGTPLLDLADTTRIEIVAELLTGDAALARVLPPPGSRGCTRTSASGSESARVWWSVMISSRPSSRARRASATLAMPQSTVTTRRAGSSLSRRAVLCMIRMLA
jgi:HlyD family secretion protein